VSFPAWVAAIVLFLQLPIPLYWFVVHPFRRVWRHHPHAVYVVSLACSWLPVTIGIAAFHRRLFRSAWPPPFLFALALVFIGFEVWIFWRVSHDLGGARLVGQKELEGKGEIQRRGIYSRIRHPRYLASFLAICGACLMAGTRITWIVAVVWMVLMFVIITMEENEMSTRFGDQYSEYCRETPRFLPRVWR
jgi:protein-S-isoprenylcysteine O-methyltransferase Ste14